MDEHHRSPVLRARDVDVNRHAVAHHRHSAERSPSQPGPHRTTTGSAGTARLNATPLSLRGLLL
jgi:hypothetical protein